MGSPHEGAFVTQGRRWLWFAAGLLAATLAAPAFQAAPVAAQQGPSAPDQRPGAPAQPGSTRRAIPDLDPGLEPEGRSSTPPDTQAATDADDPDGDPLESVDDGGVAERPHQVRSGADGDLSLPAEPEPARDGVADEREPEAPQDGADPTIDTRPPEDTALFETPPAGYDPLLFQIEDIDPLTTDRRPARLFRFEPYDPTGITIGSFVFFPDTEVAGIATDNVQTSPDGRSDVAAEITSRSRLVSNWTAHALELRATNLTSFHDDFPSEDDRAWGIEARGRLDVTRRTDLQALLSHDVAQEGRSAIDASTSGTRPDVTTDQAALTLNHTFNRLSLQLRGSITEVDYSATTNGATIDSNADRDTETAEEVIRARWELKPTFSIFAETGLDQRRYEVAAVSDGLLRNSDGERYRLGIDFGSTGQILRGEASLGFGRQTPDDARLSDVNAVLVDANLAWRVTALTSLLFSARTDIDDTSTAGSAGVISHQGGIEARHALRQYLIASAGLSYTDYDYDGAPIEENEFISTLGAEYFAYRDVILFARYQHVAFESNQPQSDYRADDVRLGVRIRQ
jgi:hypothetical protein